MGGEPTYIRHFQDLRVWREAHNLSLAIYDATRHFPKEEIYGITSQIRRAAVSIEANIAEGSKRRSTKDLCHFLTMSEGSNEEVKCLLLIVRDLKFLDQATVQKLYLQTEAVGSMLCGLIRSLNA